MANGPVNQLPAVDRIQGFVLDEYDTPQESIVRVQYTDRTGELHELAIPLLNALYLLNQLEQMSADQGYDSLHRGKS